MEVCDALSLGALSLHVFTCACGRASTECMRENALFFMHGTLAKIISAGEFDDIQS